MSIIISRVAAGLALTLLTGCAASLLQSMPQNVTTAALNQNDPDIVRAGLPSYMLMLDGMLAQAPEDVELLKSGAKLYAFYASALTDDAARAQHLTETARAYADRALCLEQPKLCSLATLAFSDFQAMLNTVDKGSLPALYPYGLVWGAWLQSRSRDWQALADRPKIEALFDRVLALDETYDGGRAHFILGMLRSQLAPSLGGKPETGKFHFERALALSQGRDLGIKVQYAKLYARMVYDRPLHDRLLNEVLQADPHASDLTLRNILAQQQARRLLDESPNYFQE